MSFLRGKFLALVFAVVCLPAAAEPSFRDRMSFDEFKELVQLKVTQVPEMQNIITRQNRYRKQTEGEDPMMAGGMIRGLIKWMNEKAEDHTLEEMRKLEPPQAGDLVREGADKDLVANKAWVELFEKRPTLGISSDDHWETLETSEFEELAGGGGSPIERVAVGKSTIYDPLGGLREIYDGKLGFVFGKYDFDTGSGVTVEAIRLLRYARQLPFLKITDRAKASLRGVPEVESEGIDTSPVNRYKITKQLRKLLQDHEGDAFSLLSQLREYGLLNHLALNRIYLDRTEWGPGDAIRFSKRLLAAGFKPQEMISARRILDLDAPNAVKFQWAAIEHFPGAASREKLLSLDPTYDSAPFAHLLNQRASADPEIKRTFAERLEALVSRKYLIVAAETPRPWTPKLTAELQMGMPMFPVDPGPDVQALDEMWKDYLRQLPSLPARERAKFAVQYLDRYTAENGFGLAAEHDLAVLKLSGLPTEDLQMKWLKYAVGTESLMGILDLGPYLTPPSARLVQSIESQLKEGLRQARAEEGLERLKRLVDVWASLPQNAQSEELRLQLSERFRRVLVDPDRTHSERSHWFHIMAHVRLPEPVLDLAFGLFQKEFKKSESANGLIYDWMWIVTSQKSQALALRTNELIAEKLAGAEEAIHVLGYTWTGMVDRSDDPVVKQDAHRIVIENTNQKKINGYLVDQWIGKGLAAEYPVPLSEAQFNRLRRSTPLRSGKMITYSKIEAHALACREAMEKLKGH